MARDTKGTSSDLDDRDGLRPQLLVAGAAAAVAAMVGAIVAALLGVLPYIGDESGSTDAGEGRGDEKVRITSPDGPTAHSPFVLAGTLHEDLDGREVWLATRKQDDTRYHPQVAPCDVAADDRFRCPPTYIGAETDAGAAFDVHVLFIDDDARRVFERYEATKPPTEYPGLAELPTGAETAAVVAVVRSRDR